MEVFVVVSVYEADDHTAERVIGVASSGLAALAMIDRHVEYRFADSKEPVEITDWRFYEVRGEIHVTPLYTPKVYSSLQPPVRRVARRGAGLMRTLTERYAWNTRAACLGAVEVFEAAFRQKLPVLLKGPTGCGKTRFVEYMSWKLLPVTAERPQSLITVACNEDLTGSDLVGRYLVRGDETLWTDGRILALQTGKWGMTPREAESPLEALRLLKSDAPFDLAILDVQMPEMDGVTLAAEVRKLKARDHLPVILLTSLGRREAGVEDLEISAFLTKPLKPSGLFDALAGFFAKGLAAPRADSGKAAIDPGFAAAHPLRILLAEDNAVNQKLALRLLEQMGYRADVASNGIEAVESVERQAYDVVLMDVQMTEMDGLDSTRAIRQLTSISQPRVIAITANAMQGDREMCLAAGMDDYVSKPIRVAELMEALSRTPSLAPKTASAPALKPPAAAARTN